MKQQECSYCSPVKLDGKGLMKQYGKKYNKQHAKTTKDYVRVLPEYDRWTGAEIVLHDYLGVDRKQKEFDAKELITECLAKTSIPAVYEPWDESIKRSLEEVYELLEVPVMGLEAAVYHVHHGDLNYIITVKPE